MVGLARREAGVCERGDVDLVYGYEIYGTPVAAKAAAAFDLPCVARYQGTLMSVRQSMAMAGARFWKHIRALGSPADLVIMTNDGTEGERYLIQNGVPADRIRFWMNGADFSIAELPSRDVRPDVSIPAEAPLLLTVSRLSHWKRVDRALRVLAEVRDRGIDAHMIVVGTGPEEESLCPTRSRSRPSGPGALRRGHQSQGAGLLLHLRRRHALAL